jgi:hypothetical protein
MRITFVAFLLFLSCLVEAQTAVVSLNLADKKGKPTPITASDLIVTANDKPVGVVRLSALREAPKTFAILVDISGSSQDKVKYLKQYAKDAFELMSSDATEGIFCLFADRVSCSKSSLSVTDLEGALEAIRPQRGAKSALFDAMKGTAARLAELAPDKEKVIVVLSDGADNASKTTLSEVIQNALGSKVTFLSIGLFGQASKSERQTVVQMARLTGGRELMFDEPGDVKKKLAEVWASQFLMTIEPFPQGTGGISVKPKSSSTLVWSTAVRQ